MVDETKRALGSVRRGSQQERTVTTTRSRAADAFLLGVKTWESGFLPRYPEADAR